MVKRIPTSLAALAALIAMAEGTAQAHVVPRCIPLESTPECADGIDNDDMDPWIDSADPQCEGSGDYSETFAGRQPPPCERIDASLWAQVLWEVQWPPDCPDCGLTLIDVHDLLTRSIQELILEVHPDWAVSVAMKLEKPVANLFDDPKIPNLRLRYAGGQVIGPGDLGPLLLLADPSPQPALRYVGRAFDMNTGKMVTNVGTLNPQ